jgi:hypothetical protein
MVHLMSLLLVVMGLLLAPLACVSRQGNPSRARTTDTPSIALNFSGKGTLLTYDYGVIDTLTRHGGNPLFASPVLTGNSSGSILAAFLSCNGLSPDSMTRLQAILDNFDYRLVNDSPTNKLNRFKRTIRSENSSLGFRHFLEQSLVDKNGSPCIPRLPVAINATNADVTDMRLIGGGYFNASAKTVSPQKSASNRWLDPATMDVYEKTADGERGAYLGKSCTNFVNAPMKALMEKVPEDKRICDLREIATPMDLVKAVLASVSEPMLFPAVGDVDFNAPPLGNLDLAHGPLSDPIWQRILYMDLLTNYQGDLLKGIDDIAQISRDTLESFRADPSQHDQLAVWDFFPDDGLNLGSNGGLDAIRARWAKKPAAMTDPAEIAEFMLNAHLGLKSNQRYFVGGFGVASQAAQLRLASPSLVTFSTGREDLSAGSNAIMSLWFTVNANTVWPRQRAALDWEAYPWSSRTLSQRDEKLHAEGLPEDLLNGLGQVWNKLMTIDIDPETLDTTKFQRLARLRQQVSLDLGRLTAEFCLIGSFGAAPNVVLEDGTNEPAPSLARQERARQAARLTGIAPSPERSREAVREFLASPLTKELLAL